MRVKCRTALTVALLVAMSASAHAAESAAAQFAAVQKGLHDSHAANDWRANLEYARRQRDLLNGSPDSRLEVARAELFLGATTAGIGELSRYAQMGQSVDPDRLAPDWKALRRQHGIARLERALEENRHAIGKRALAFVLTDSALLPEDIDYDGNTGFFYISSVREKKIVTATRDGKIEEFSQAPDGWPIVALKLDTKRHRLWATEVAMHGYEFAHPEDWGKSVILCFDLGSRALLKRFDGPRGSALGDMVLTKSGDVILSDGDGGGIYRLPSKGSQLERLDRGDFISPQTAALGPDDRYIFVPDYLRGIALLDLRSHRVQWIPMAGRFALSGIDGMYSTHDRLIAVQNGTSPERVVMFRLQRTNRAIASEGVIERATPTLGDPTHGVIADESFYYIANSGWDVLDEHGKLRPGKRMSPARIMRTELPGL